MLDIALFILAIGVSLAHGMTNLVRPEIFRKKAVNRLSRAVVGLPLMSACRAPGERTMVAPAHPERRLLRRHGTVHGDDAAAGLDHHVQLQHDRPHRPGPHAVKAITSRAGKPSRAA